jgi:hypothetical protein
VANLFTLFKDAVSFHGVEVKKSRFSHMWRPPSLCVFPYVSG